MGTLSGEVTLLFSLASLLTGVNIQRKEFAPLGGNFSLRVGHILKEFYHLGPVVKS